MYIEHEIYHMTYNKEQDLLNDYQFMEGVLLSGTIILHSRNFLGIRDIE